MPFSFERPASPEKIVRTKWRSPVFRRPCMRLQGSPIPWSEIVLQASIKRPPAALILGLMGGVLSAREDSRELITLMNSHLFRSRRTRGIMRDGRRSREESGSRCAGAVLIVAMVSAILFGGGCAATVSGRPNGGGPPSVSITSPAANASLTGVVTVTASATDVLGVASVQFKVDNTNAGLAITNAPYSYALNTNTLSNGNHTLAAVATGTSGLSAASAGVPVKISNTAPDTTAPVVTITSPANNAGVSGTITLTATATDADSPVSFVQFRVDGANLGAQITAAPYSTSLDTKTLPNGTHTLSAFGADPSGNQGTSAPTNISVANTTGSTMGPLVQSTINSHYFVDKNGKAVVLTGSHTWNDFQDTDTSGSPAAFDFNSYVASLKAHGQNATILWHQDLPQFCGFPPGGVWKMTPWPWQRTGPGNATDGDPRFDLTQFNQAYFDRLRQRVMQLEQNNIYAIVELFGGEWIGSFRCGTTSPAGDGYPLTGLNNVNGVDDGYTSGSNGSVSITTATPNAFTTIQVAYMKKVVDTLNDLPNVLWEIDEEPVTGTENWHNYIISQLRSYEAAKPNKHPIGYTTMRYPGNDTELLNSSADWIAPMLSGGAGNVVSPVNNCGTGTPACKIILNDSDHSFYYPNFLNSDGSVQNQKLRNYIWENFTAGSSVVFMDPYGFYWPKNNRNFCTGPVNGICSGVDTKYDSVRNAMGYVVSLTAKLDLVKMTPRSTLSSTTRCLANDSAIGAEFVVYAPTGGTFTVNLSAQSGRTLVVEWLNPATGASSSGGTVSGGSAAESFTPPFSGDAVLYLVDSTGHN
jgi:Big-like domain-containing protein/collagenase-like protein with putative collagen-binding domain